MTYNKIRHLELLKRFLDFRKQSKDLYRENRDEYMELQEYRCALYHHIFWKSKEQFVLLMDNFIQDSIDMEQFEIAFSQLWWETMKVYDAFEIDLKGLKNFKLDPKSDGFGPLSSVNLKFWKMKSAPSKRLRITFGIFSRRSNHIYNLKLF